MEGSISVVIVDAYPIIRWAARKFLGSAPGFSVLNEAGSIGEAAELVRSAKPDIVIADVLLPDGDLTQGLADLTDGGVVPVLAFSEHDTWNYVEAFLNVGGAGFISKRAPLEELAQAMQAAMRGEKWVSPIINVTRMTCPDKVLSAREREIVALIAQGHTSNAIGTRLYLSRRTVENHRHRIFKKLGVQNSAQLVDYVARHDTSQN